MKIWLVNQYAISPGQAGGTRHHSLATALIARGHQVTLIAADLNYATQQPERLNLDEQWRHEVLDGVPYVWLRVPAYAGNSIGRVWSMVAFGRRLLALAPQWPMPRPDVVIGSSPHLFAADAAERLARRFGVPFVLEVRDLWPKSLVDVAGLSPLHPLVLLLARLERRLYRRARAIITLLPGAAPHMVAQGADPDRIHCIPNGIALDLVPPPAPRMDGPFTVIYAGAHGVANALDSLLDAATLLKDEDIHFRFIGAGPEKSRLIERARDLPNVRFEDPVPKAAIYAELAQADAFLASLRDLDLYQHGISLNKLYDFLAMARPTVFGARAANNPIAEAHAGLVVPPEDAPAMAEALRQLRALSPAERWAMGQRGRAYVEEHFDTRKLAERLEGVLRAL